MNHFLFHLEINLKLFGRKGDLVQFKQKLYTLDRSLHDLEIQIKMYRNDEELESE